MSPVNKVSSYRQKMMGLILTIAILLSFLPASRLLADGTQTLNVESYSACAFQNDLSLVYYYKIKSPGDFTNIRLRVAYQRFDYNNPGAYTWETSDIRDYTYDPQTQMYRFVFKGIAAAEMGNTVRTAFCANIGNQAYASPEQRFSIKQYAEKILELKGTSTDEKDKLLCTLVVDMLNYGAAAQKYFGRNVSALVNANLTEVQKKMGSEPVSNMESIATIEPLSGAKAAFKFASVEFNNTVDLVTYIQMTGDLKDTVYAEVSYTGVDGQTRTSKTSAKNFKLKDGLYGARFSNIAALYFRSPLKIVIKDGNTAISPVLNYSFESYVRDINIGDYKESMKELGRYMLAYGDSAYKYFTYSGSGSGSTTDPDDIVYEGIRTYKNSKYTTDMPNTRIVIPAKASAEEQYAAGLLQKYIQKEDGYQPQIVTDATSQGSAFEISVGNTNRPHGTVKYTSDGAYKIKSYSNGIAILGNGKRGTIDGAMKFLAICGGYYWLSFEDGYKTNQTHFKYATNIDIDHERAFTFTDTDPYFGITYKGENRMFSLAGAMNGFYVNCTVSDQPGGQKWYLSKCKEGAYGTLQPGQAHTLMAEYITEDQFAEHPEWFSLYIEKKDGKIVVNERRPYQLCLSNEEVYEKIRDHVFEILESSSYDPNAPMQIICLAQQDGPHYCMCSDCYDFRKKYEVEGKKEGLCDAAMYLNLCNRISREVKATGKYPNVYIDMLAYTHNLKPPVGMEMDDHVIVRYAAICRCYAHNADENGKDENGVVKCDQNAEVSEYLKGWEDLTKKYGGQLWIWDYVANFTCTAGPYMNFDSLVHDIKYYQSIGVKGVYLQNNDSPGSLNTEFGDLRNYLITVLLENPNADAEKEMEFFVTEFYGKSGPYILEAMKLMQKQAKRHQPGPNADPYGLYYRDICTTYNAPTSQVFGNMYPTKMDAHNEMDPDDLAKCEALWNRALEEAESDTAEHKYRTGRTHLGWRWTKSCMKVYEFADPATYKSMNEQLHTDLYRTYGMTIYALTYRKTPGKAYLSNTPDRWLNEKPWEEIPKYKR